MFFHVGRENSDENAAKTDTISAVNVDTPCNVFSRTAEYRVFQRWQLLFLINSIGYRKMAKVELQRVVNKERVYAEYKKLCIQEIGKEQDDLIKLRLFYEKLFAFLHHYIFLKFNEDDNELYVFFKDKAFRLNYLKIETPYPFLMQVLESYKQEKLGKIEVLDVFSIIEGYLARRILCNIPTTGLNKFFAGLHKEIEYYLDSSQGYSYSEILSYILQNRSGGVRIPRNTEIKSAIDNNPIYTQRNNYINFILSSVDDYSKESNLLRQIASDNTDLSIEHIMPQKLNKKWIDSLGEYYQEEHLRYLHTLPNLTLTGYNSKYSNKDFAYKKSIENGFSDSPLLINRHLAQYEKWDFSSLKTRADWWYENIVKLWPLPESSFKPKVSEKELYLLDKVDLKNTKIKSIIVMEEFYDCKTWSSAMGIILSKLFALEEVPIDSIISDTFL